MRFPLLRAPYYYSATLHIVRGVGTAVRLLGCFDKGLYYYLECHNDLLQAAITGTFIMITGKTM